MSDRAAGAVSAAAGPLNTAAQSSKRGTRLRLSGSSTPDLHQSTNDWLTDGWRAYDFDDWQSNNLSPDDCWYGGDGQEGDTTCRPRPRTTRAPPTSPGSPQSVWTSPC